jgi:PTH1 family peptidyl-tRNA hydrolase
VRLKKALKAKPKPRAKKPSNPVRAVVGLRNPGSEYEGTRHNVGYEVVTAVVARSGVRLGKSPSRLRSSIGQVGVGGERVLYVVPNTFMNQSGAAVRAVLDYYGLDVGSLLVVHDDIDLPFGRLRLQVAGGSGGHNGIRSLEESLGTREFSRLKVGVGRPPGSMDPADFVLRGFTKTERPDVDVTVEEAADVVEMWPSDPDRAQELAASRGRG